MSFPGRIRRSILAAFATVVMTVTLAPALSADEVDQLIADLEQVSHDTSAQNEEVKAIEIEIEDRLERIDDIIAQVTSTRTEADDAKALQDAYRVEVDRIAQAKYRGSVVDPLTTAVGADNPQNAIDRLAYMSLLTSRTEDAVGRLADATGTAAAANGEANRVKAEHEFQIGELQQRRNDLDREREELENRTREIRERVDGLSESDRQRWVEKNGPVDPALVDVFGAIGEGTGAVAAALSKIGAPYGWGAVGPDAFDCSGLIYWAYQQHGKTLPRTSQAMMAGGTPVSRDQLQPGDVIGYYPGATHVGMYIGDGRIVHASDYGIPVQVVSVDSAPFYGARRY